MNFDMHLKKKCILKMNYKINVKILFYNAREILVNESSKIKITKAQVILRYAIRIV